MMKYKAIIFDMDGTQASFVQATSGIATRRRRSHSDSANYAGQAIIERAIRRGVVA
jgi:hypothetical protein